MFRALLFVGLCSPAVLSRVENQVQGATGAVSRATHGRQPGDTAAFTAISNGEQVSYPKPMYSEGAAQSYIPAGREGVKAKTKGCLHCMLFNSKQKVAKKYGDMYKKAMGRSIKKSRADAIGVQMQDQDIATMQERTGDKLYGSGGQSDIDRRRKDGEEKKCFDLPADKQEECLKRAKAMEPDPIKEEITQQLSANPHSIDEPPPPNAGPPFNVFVEESARQVPDTHANEVLLNPSIATGTFWDPDRVKSYTDPVESANIMGPGDDGLSLLLQTTVCGNEKSVELLTALYQAVVGDDLVVQCEPAAH